VRYRYLSYKYLRRGRAEAGFQHAWDAFGGWPLPSTVIWRPPTDIYETPGCIVIVIELAGMSEDDMSVTLFSDQLVVEGRRKQPEMSDMKACHQLGIKYGDFRSEISLHTPVERDDITVDYKNGMLIISLRKPG
jgi:HSP20 family protein